MENKIKRFLSLALALLMVFSMMPQITIGAEAAGANSVNLAGTFNGWDTSATPMTMDGVTGTCTLELVAGTYEFKVVENGSAWMGNDGTIADTTTATSNVGWEFTSGAGNCKLVASGGKYHFSYNSDTNFLVITYEAADVEKTPYAPEVGLYAVGSTVSGSGFMNGVAWNPAAASNKMSETSDDVYEITFTDVSAGDYELKVAADGAWTHSWGTGAAVTSGQTVDTYYNGGNSTLAVAEDGSTVTIKIDMTSTYAVNQSAKLTVTVAAPACEHDWENGVCQNGCGEEHTHNTVESVVTKEPTCGETGLQNTVCSDCGYVLEKDSVLPATGEHTFEDAEGTALEACSVCGAENPDYVPETPAISGTFNGALINVENAERTFISAELKNVYATKSVVLKLYDENGTLLATTSLVDRGDILGTNFETLSMMVGINCTDSYWDTVWEEGKLSADYVPAYGTLYIDGTEMNTKEINMASTSGEVAVNWAEVPGVNPAPAEPAGTITGCLVDLSDSAETFIASEINGLNATESVVIKLYSGETQIATTTLLKSEYFNVSPLGVKIIITGESSSWKTEWAEGMPRADVIPDKVVLYVDDTEMNSAAVPMTSTNGELPVDWATVPGVNPAPVTPTTYQVSTKAELDAAVAAAEAGDVITLIADIDYTGTAALEINKAITLDLGGKTLTTHGTYGGLRLKGGCSLKNGTLAHEGTVCAIKAWDVASIQDVAITVAYREGKTIGGIVIQQNAAGIDTIEDVTITGEGLTNGIETYECGNAAEPVIGSMNNVTIDAVGTGMLISAPCGTATNCTIEGGKSGIEIFIKGTYSATLDLVNCTVNGGVNAHDEYNSNPDIVNEGTLKLTVDNATTGVTTDDITLTIARAEKVEGVLADVMDNAVVMNGNTYYTSLDAALADAKADGLTEVEITVLGDIEFSTAVKDFTKVTFNGTNREQTIDMNLGTAVDVKTELVFNDLTVSRLDSDWLYHYTYIRGGLTYNNCKMVGLFNVTAQDTTFNKCDFYNDDTFGNGNYSLWLSNCLEGVVVNVTDCTFDVYERAIKMYGDNYSGEMTLNISGTTFTSRTADKTVVEMAYDNSNGVGSMNLNITDSSATGFGAPEHIEGEANAWFNVEGTDTVSTVTIDGTEVWPVSVPTGTLGRGYVSGNYVGEVSAIWGEANIDNAKESFKVEVYSGETLIVTSTLVDNDKVLLDGEAHTVTWHAAFYDDGDSWWNTVWAEGYPNINMAPDKVVLYVDDTEVAENSVVMGAPDYENNVVALAEGFTGGVKVYTNLTDAIGKFNGREVNVLRDVTEEIVGFYGVTLTTNVEGGVTITNTDTENWIDFTDFNIGTGVTVNTAAVHVNGQGVDTITGTLNATEIYYHQGESKVTIKDGGKLTVNGAAHIRYNENADAGLYIYGDGNDETVELDVAYYLGAYSGTVYAENANVEVGYMLLNGETDSTDYAAVELELNNSTFKTTGTTDGQKQFNTDGDATINLTNGSSVEVLGDFNAADTVVVSLDATSSITAANIAYVATYDELVAALEAGKDVVLTADITATGEINGTDANIDLGGNKLTLTVGGTNFYGDSTIENGTIDITGCVATGDCIIGIGDYSNDATLNLNNVNVTGDGYDSAYAVLYVYGSSTLNINGGSVVVSNDSAAAGGVIKAESAANGKINITGTESDPVELTFTDAKVGILDGTVVMDYVDLDITGGANAINQSALTVKNSTLTIKDCDGRALTLNDGDVTIENSTLDFSGAAEGEIRFKKGLTLTVDANSTINECDIWTDAEGANVNGIAVTGTESEMSTVTVADGVTTVKNPVTGLSGTGTEEEPYLINNLEELIWFRDSVNTYTSDGSNQYKNKFVKLTADIDLAGINWEPIGTNSVGDHMAFLGTFDGDGHTISNLYINGDGGHLGFFARVGSYGEDVTPTVKNLKFVNVDVSSNTTTSHTGSYVGGVIANAGGNSVVSNVTVSGDVYVAGYGYVGGIVGHGYPDLTNCHVIANEGSYLNCYYWCAGGIIGYAGEGGTPITNCSVSGLDIWSAYGAAAAVAGLLQDGNTMTNVSASDVKITSASDYVMGYVAGNGEASTLTNVTATNVTATANGKEITSTDAVAQVGDAVYFDLASAFAAAQDGDTVTILRAGTYTLSTSGKDITITGAVDGVVFDNIGAKNMGGANVTFNNVTFDYLPNTNYTGLQHSGNLVYNNCTFNGTVFLYGASETFNDCTFNVEGDAYNVWTYGAKVVKFEGCTFNSTGKSVLVYNEGACATDLTVTDCKFIASSSFEGKAAIEISGEHLNAEEDGYHKVNIYGETTATGFAAGSVSGNTLWNDKYAAYESYVYVDGELVWPVPQPAADLSYAGYVDVTGEAGTESYRESIKVDMYNVYAESSLVVELWSGETKLSTTTLRETDRDDETAELYPVDADSFTANIIVSGRLAGSWDTEWHVVPAVDNIPDTIKVYADGELVDTWNEGFINDTEKAEYLALTGVHKSIIATDESGNVTYYTSLDDLFAADFGNDEVNVELLENVSTDKQVNTTESQACYNFVTNVEGGASVTFAYANDWNSVRHMSIGTGVTLNTKHLYVYGGVFDVYGTVTTDYAYTASSAVTVKDGGVLNVTTGDATVQVKNSGWLEVYGTVNAGTVNVWNDGYRGSHLIVSGENAQLDADHIHAWNGGSSGVVNEIIVEDGATLTAAVMQADRGATVTVDAATLTAETLTLGYEGNVGTLTVQNGGVVTNGAILNSVGSTVTGPEGMNVTTELEGKIVAYENGVYSVVDDPAYGMVAMIDEDYYATVAEAVEAAVAGDTIVLIADAEEELLVLLEGVTLDLNGNDVTVSNYVGIFATNHVIDSVGGGLLKGTENVMIDDENKALPIWDDTNKGYAFADKDDFNELIRNQTTNSLEYVFLPVLDPAEYALIAQGAEVSGVTMKVEVSWMRTDAEGDTMPTSVTFIYTNELMEAFVNAINPETGAFGSAFNLRLSGTEGKTLAFKVYFESDTGAILECN